jgi:carbamoyltransferase
MIVLGINAYHGDVSAALVRDGVLVAAVEEERFRRVKHWAGFPEQAIRACLSMAGAEPREVDAFAISRNPAAHRLRKTWFVLRNRPAAALLIDRARNVRRLGGIAREVAHATGLDEAAVRRRLHWVEHHPAHLASSFFVSPFDDATVCAIDGFGDFVSTSVARGVGSHLAVLDRIYFPHSLGLLYLAVTQWLGFPKYGDEFKVMGLAPYGDPRRVNPLRSLVGLESHGRFRLDLSYFRHVTDGVEMTWESGEPSIGCVFTRKLETLLGPARRPDEPLTDEHEAIAASLQQVYEEAAFHVLRAAHARTQSPRLCLAGGCALNSVANGKIRDRTPFEDVYIQAAAGDNGTALGAAFCTWHRLTKQPRRFVMTHSYWGPEYDDAAIERAIVSRDAEVRALTCARQTIADPDALCEWAATQLAAGSIVGWFQGRMEWGARALGNRSILADPRRADMREIINSKIKYREKFRPFAPSTLVEAAADYFVGAVPDPFMIQVVPVRPDRRGAIPAVTHVDGSGRLHTVDRGANPLYWTLIERFGRLTGVPVLLNTSFNENEPIVLTPAEALDCFLRTSMDVLIMGHHLLAKRPDATGVLAAVAGEGDAI